LGANECSIEQRCSNQGVDRRSATGARSTEQPACIRLSPHPGNNFWCSVCGQNDGQYKVRGLVKQQRDSFQYSYDWRSQTSKKAQLNSRSLKVRDYFALGSLSRYRVENDAVCPGLHPSTTKDPTGSRTEYKDRRDTPKPCSRTIQRYLRTEFMSLVACLENVQLCADGGGNSLFGRCCRQE
jgi:hypothetical protein